MVTQMGNLSGILNIYIQTIVGVFTLKNMLGLFVATSAIIPLTMVSMSLIVVVGVLKLVSELMNEDLSPNM
jgi:hypothetical protein